MKACVLCGRTHHVVENARKRLVFDGTGHCPACATGINDARASLIPERPEWPHRQVRDGDGGCVLDGFPWPCPQAIALHPPIVGEYAEFRRVLAEGPVDPATVRDAMAAARALTHRPGTNVSSHAKAKATARGEERRTGPGPRPPSRPRPN